MTIVSRISATIAVLIVGIAGVLVLVLGAIGSGDTDWNFLSGSTNSGTVSTNGVTDCDWNTPC